MRQYANILKLKEFCKNKLTKEKRKKKKSNIVIIISIYHYIAPDFTVIHSISTINHVQLVSSFKNQGAVSKIGIGNLKGGISYFKLIFYINIFYEDYLV